MRIIIYKVRNENRNFKESMLAEYLWKINIRKLKYLENNQFEYVTRIVEFKMRTR